MQRSISSIKVGLDILWVQVTWTIWALGVILLVHIGRMMFGINTDSFYSAGMISANIYMLVFGIMAIHFLLPYVEHGITRKTYFKGNLLASIGLSIINPIFIYVISLFEKLLVNSFTSTVLSDQTLEEVVIDLDGNLIGEIILSILLAPFVSPETNSVLSLAIFGLHIFVFYIVGWMIAAAFYRLGVIGGLLFIAIGLVFIAVKDSMVRLALDQPLFQNFSGLGMVPESMALPMVFIVILITIGFIRLLTKRAQIDI